MNVVEIDFTVIGRGANDGSFVVLHHILINDCFCLDWLKWTLLAKEKGYMEQGYMSIWIGFLMCFSHRKRWNFSSREKG
ncbi:uncharacterized protein MONOS_3135 [Monocercomonoides exilis]|uniref:uncharacterized protein n=1 Tax=Monocercomonoides exilis TaxID=2049356 RepID=UPI00355AB2D9|nr:hypothetical protein MONOS_3135 [Monocercomonoides exilis]